MRRCRNRTIRNDIDRRRKRSSRSCIAGRSSFPISRLLRGFVEGRNLNDVARIRYAAIPTRRTAHEIYSRDFYAGIDWRF